MKNVYKIVNDRPVIDKTLPQSLFLIKSVEILLNRDKNRTIKEGLS